MADTRTAAIKEILRNQAWQRAKGELHAVLTTYYGEGEKFNKLNDDIHDFIRHIECSAILEVSDS